MLLLSTTLPGQTTTTVPTDISVLAAQEAQAFADADAALKIGDLATYAAKIKVAQGLAAQIAAKLPAPPTTTTTTPVPSTPPTTAKA